MIINRIILLFAIFSSCHSLFFRIPEGQQRCFVEPAIKRQVTLGDYENPDFDSYNTMLMSKGFPSAGLDVIVTSPQSKEIVKRSVHRHGRFAFTADEDGEYIICVKSNVTIPNIPRDTDMRFSIHFHKSEEIEDELKNAADTKTVEKLEDKVNGLRDKTTEMIGTQKIQKKAEETFRDTSESTNSYVVWWSIAQICLLIVVATSQVFYLRSFFMKKKLV